ncbi:MAG: DUF721 domain-containing protein [Streptosporangiales bacterium]|nr:DUF721 domain-containing protein [Streptosporangiales bacterium]
MYPRGWSRVSNEFDATGGRRSPGEPALPEPRTGPRPDGEAAAEAGAEPDSAGLSGIDRAREALRQAKADARDRGAKPGDGTPPRRRRRGRSVRAKSPDPRRFGAVIGELLSERGWETRAAVGGIFGRWPDIVGPEVAEHTRPQSFDEGELVVLADSMAWAQQVRLLAPTLVRRLNEELGHGTVRKVKVRGPSGPRRTGGWRVRGSRDTYG